jgi:hypothetical protein
MDETKIKFGDKIFAYGLMADWDKAEELGLINPSYNTVMGYTAVGGYYIVPQKTNQVDVCLPGFVMDFIPSLASQTLFARMEMIDVTNLLSRQEPTLSGTKVWMPIP